MNTFEEGFELFKLEPDLLLVEVWHRAQFAWTEADRIKFVEGYIAARRQRDQHVQEQA